MKNDKWKMENGNAARIAEGVSPRFSIFHLSFVIFHFLSI